MIEVRYRPGTGGEFLLNRNYEIAIKECNPHSTAWTYESVARKYGIEITSFGKDPIELSMVFKFRGSEGTISENLNEFFEACERDILEMKQGTLYIGEQYLKGYFIQRETVPSEEFYGYEQSGVFLAPYPFYITEETRQFPPISAGDVEEEFLDYEYDYDYDYTAQDGGNIIWKVDHFAPCEFLMTIYGPAVNPYVTINGHIYQVYTELSDNEYLKIDSRENSIMKYLANATQKDIYDLRRKDQSVFDPITPGNISVVWPGEYGIDLTLFCERSEPRWKTPGS